MSKQAVVGYLMFALVGVCCVARLVSMFNLNLPKF